MTTIEKPLTQARQCSRCILDTHDDPGMIFDEQGVCNYCNMYDGLPKYDFSQGDPAKAEREELIRKIKASGKGKDYDCLIGLSGGVDSTYLAYQAHKMGLRPLAVHFDNGWNSELAVKNIENVVSKLGIDLYTYVIDWEEFRDMQVAFFKASVIDIEALTDHAIYAALIKLASKNKIRYMLSGNN
ncbi:MAG: 7-cyano-7-deazaguanine synthase, partial [Bacteroidota bacterium]